MNDDATSKSQIKQIAESRQYVCDVCGNYVRSRDEARAEDDYFGHDRCVEVLV